MTSVSETDTDSILLPAALRRPAVALLLVCVGTTMLLGGRYAGQSDAGWLDAAIGVRVRAALGGYPWFLGLVWLGDKVTVAMTAAGLLIVCLYQRRWRAVVLVAVAVAGAGATTELWLKPFINRTFLGELAFPSGHATGVFVLAAVASILLVNPPRRRTSGGSRLVLALFALATASLVSVAVLAANSHYATDVVGGAAVGVSAVLATTLVVDRVFDRRR